jgi:hypothetical protein
MEVLLIHKPIGVLPPEAWTAIMEIGKKAEANPGEVVPGGKLMVSYSARALSTIVCLWEVPSVEAMMPALEQLNMLGLDTDIIPVEKTAVSIPKFEQALKAMQAK